MEPPRSNEGVADVSVQSTRANSFVSSYSTNNRPAALLFFFSLFQRPPEAKTINQLKAGLFRLAKHDAALASKVWQDLGHAVFPSPPVDSGAFPALDGHDRRHARRQQQEMPVTKEELERELAKVQLETERRLVHFFLSNGMTSLANK
jgi:hypothetical protein